MKLSELKLGQIGKISKINQCEISIILIERGFIKGEEIEVLHSDIFNDVRIYQIMGSKIALRKSEANIIEVNLLN